MKGRSRYQWNERLEHWERPASDSEEEKIDRAAMMVRKAVDASDWLSSQSVIIYPQGSYHNNTNVRLDSDMDMRAVHPLIRVEYGQNVVRQYAWQSLQYLSAPCTVEDMSGPLRREVTRALVAHFGSANVDGSGGRAIHIKGLPNTRAEADVVPAFKLDHITWDPVGRYVVNGGVAILSTSGVFTFNFPEQQHANGLAKRERTRQRFKRNVRMLKRLRAELEDLRRIPADSVPSFLVECLVYCVEDVHFLVEPDERYDRLLRVVRRLRTLLASDSWVTHAREISGLKLLFHSAQKWTSSGALAFAQEAQAYLEA